MAFIDFVNWSTGLRNSMSKALHRIASNLGPDDTKWIEGQIEQIRTELTDGYSQITSLRSEYKELIKKYFENSRPFPTSPKTFQSDLKQYRKLIAHSMFLEDLSFLEYWGVEYPRSQKFEVLANQVSDYVIAFQRICDDKKYRETHDFSEGVVPYYKQLKEWLSK